MANGTSLPHEIILPIVTQDLQPILFEQWERVRSKIEKEIGDTEYRLWLSGMLMTGLDGDVLVIYLPSRLKRDYVLGRYGTRLTTLWQQENPLISRIEFLVDKKAESLAKAIEEAKTPIDLCEDPVFNDFDPEMHTLGYKAPPSLPLEVFGDFWTGWLKRAGTAASAPIDYWALPLLT
jgi:chromosomal replication initiation ATPase DnaA